MATAVTAVEAGNASGQNKIVAAKKQVRITLLVEDDLGGDDLGKDDLAKG